MFVYILKTLNKKFTTFSAQPNDQNTIETENLKNFSTFKSQQDHLAMFTKTQVPHMAKATENHEI